MADKDKESWELCRQWLQDPKCMSRETKTPHMADLKDEYEFYEYLKDGTTLCRLISLLPQKHRGRPVSIDHR